MLVLALPFGLVTQLRMRFGKALWLRPRTCPGGRSNPATGRGGDGERGVPAPAWRRSGNTRERLYTHSTVPIVNDERQDHRATVNRQRPWGGVGAPRPLVERCRNQSHHGQDASVFVVLMSDELALGTEQLVFGAYVPAHMSDAERHMSDALSHMSDAERQMSDALSHMSDALRLQRYLDGFSRFVPLCATCRSPRLRRTSTIWAVSLIRSLDCMLLPRARRRAWASTAAGRHICLVTGAPSGRPSGTLRP